MKSFKESTNSKILSVDVQPEYHKNGFNDNYLKNYVNFINKQENGIIFLYNGVETLGMVSEKDYIYWLFENGIDEQIIESSKFYDKGYAFFRYCIDSGIYEDDVVDLIKYMYINNITDSRDMKNNWDEFIEIHGHDHIRELMEFSSDCINVPDLMDYLKTSNVNNCIVIGGGRNECLKEVEIALKALNFNYTAIENLIY